jgi:hypothetical protein
MKYSHILRASLLFILVFRHSKVFSQESSIVKKVKDANYIEVYFLKGKQPCIYKTKRKIDLTYLKTLITAAKNNPTLKSDTTGVIIYFKDRIELAKAYFSSKGTGSERAFTGAVIFKDGNRDVISLLNYGSGMLLNEEFYQLQHIK